MSTQLTAGDIQKFIDASNAVYYRAVPSNLTLLMTSTNDAHGFYAEAFEDQSTGRILIAYEGTSANNTIYADATKAADVEIVQGLPPDAFAYAKAFYETVRASDITGDSLSLCVRRHKML